ncbi:TauD/TfdA family dioxygenase [uncultured Thiodictyon sp.]|uniref:TauD/TfdA family dioxygenase n=1 Tax=uncultured Thiodictyon sp. TaxID=1846217 RepID=UPI0025DE8738|nr:TauD/TfdA family dioxygenase [uncultured Thiodictyon sp.]
MKQPLTTPQAPPAGPFALADPDAYGRWRDARLAAAPTSLADLIVAVRDPRDLTAAEIDAILGRCRHANMAIYVGQTGDDPDKTIPARLGAQLGLHRLDHNRGADEDAITSLRIQTDARHAGYIPYTDRPIAWHTDGYYNTPERQIHGLLLHCVHPAAAGGANALLDHEIAYCLVRDQDPNFIRVLMHPRCMTIPANPGDGADEGTELRPEQSGPVFSVRADGRLHMRYTNRARNIVWRDDPLTLAAVDCLKTLLHTPSPWHLEGRLEPGWGLICNNVLHTRTRFTEGPLPRLIYRARYYDRIAGT